MFGFLQKLVEEKIQKAQQEGQFDNLRGKGEPLRMDDDGMVPEDLRLAYKILKDANCLPEELELHREILTLRDLLDVVRDEDTRRNTVRRLNFKVLKLNMMRKRPVPLDIAQVYYGKILQKLS